MKILIVEDDADTSEVVARFLESNGHQVAMVADTNEALTVLVPTAPDAVLLDLSIAGLPAENFIPVVKKRFPRCKIVIMSASINVQQIARAMS